MNIHVHVHSCSIVYLCLPVCATVQAAHIQEYMFSACAGLANVPVHVQCMYMYVYVYDLGGYLMSMQLHVHVHVSSLMDLWTGAVPVTGGACGTLCLEHATALFGGGRVLSQGSTWYVEWNVVLDAITYMICLVG